ncbi:acylneuraminate cytidylyltransferase family protein [Gracilimonas amylolytica]|uniref:acylneuraminate cytidylyltransferase family protein n=1 Tax=Gracilimonas amylolytica TaxID=1749045 RepID=UPI000CD9645A|nr:acylneuraminate cytidylyltransferase family protein [Gracilimonas amylolytica]
MNLLITICARGGSKGIPGKNIKPLNGKPLLHYTFNRAFEFAKLYDADIQLSTDDNKIIKSAEAINYKTDYLRPKNLATDKAGKIDVIKHAFKYAEGINNKRYDYLLDLDVTSPLRTINDLKGAFEKLKRDKNALNIFSVNHASKNPYFNMVEEKDANGYVELVKSVGDVKARQEAPIVYDMNASFYFFTREYLEGNYKTSVTDRSLAYVMKHISFDLDHPVDFTMMEIMLREDLLDIEI